MLRRLLIALLPLTASALTVTYGVNILQCTATTSSGSPVVSVACVAGWEFQPKEGQIWTLPGVSGYWSVASVADPVFVNPGYTVAVTMSSNLTATVSSVIPKCIIQGLDHTSLQLWIQADTAGYARAKWNDVSNTWQNYKYGTFEQGLKNDAKCQPDYTGVGGYICAATITGLVPGNSAYIRGLVKPTKTGNTDETGSVSGPELVVTMPADTHVNGLPEPPIPPVPVAAWAVPPPDTTGYNVYRVPQFDDGTKVTTSTLNAGTSTFTVNDATNMNVGDHIFFIGDGSVKCPGMGYGTAPWCKIASKSGNTISLVTPVDVTVANGSPILWSIYSIRDQMLAGHDWGCVYRWKQRYMAKWWFTNGPIFANEGLWAATRSTTATAAGCANSPCLIDDPNHPWMVWQTESTPGLLPPAGVTAGPEWSAMGGIELQNTTSPSGLHSIRIIDNSHHISFENLIIKGKDTVANAANPPIWYSGYYFNLGLQYIRIDRNVFGDDIDTRYGPAISSFGGKNIFIGNNHVRVSIWKPCVFDIPFQWNGKDIAYSGSTITITGPITWQRSCVGPSSAQPSTTINATGTATGTVNVVGYLDNTSLSKMHIRYTSGQGITVTCADCQSVSAVTTPTVPVTGFQYIGSRILTGGNTFTCDPPLCSGGHADTSASGLYEIIAAPSFIEYRNGKKHLIQNNWITAVGIGGIFMDIPSNYPQNDQAPPSDITIRRNYSYWPEKYRYGPVANPASAGLRFRSRHAHTEFKRGERMKYIGNRMSGAWAQENFGNPNLWSPTASYFQVMSYMYLRDIDFMYNWCDRGPSICVGSAYGGRELENWINGVDLRRTRYSHNLMTNLDGFKYIANTPVSFLGVQFSAGGHDAEWSHNTVVDGRGNMPNLGGGGFMQQAEGWYIHSNTWWVHHDGYTGMIFNKDELNQGGLLMVPSFDMTSANADYATGFDQAVARFGSSVVPNYTWSKNLYICGRYTSVLSEVSSSTCATTKGKFGGLQSGNYFEFTNETLAAREAAAGISRITGRLTSASPYRSQGAHPGLDGANVGVDFVRLEKELGITKAVAVLDPSDKTHVTIKATVTDAESTCYLQWGLAGAVSSWTQTADASNTAVRSWSLTGLARHTEYGYVVGCDAQPRTDFQRFATR